MQEKRTVKLSVIIGANPIGEYSFELSEGEKITFGRAEDNMLVIPSRLVSRHHGLIRMRNGCLECADCCSSNGTLVGSRFLRGKEGALVWLSLETPGILKIDSISGSLSEHVEILVSMSQALAAKRVALDPQKEICLLQSNSSCPCGSIFLTIDNRNLQYNFHQRKEDAHAL